MRNSVPKYTSSDLTTLLSIDTGIDYTHPALGGKIGPGNKVIGGYDFVGDLYDGTARSVRVCVCVHTFFQVAITPYRIRTHWISAMVRTLAPEKNSMILINNLNTGHGTHVAVCFSVEVW